MGRPRVLLADDHTLVVEGLRKLLEPEFEVVGVVSDGQALLDTAAEIKPDIIILDIGMPLLSGMKAGRELRALAPRAKLVVLTMNEDSEIAREALRQWASAYLLKKSTGTELIRAVREILKGKSYVTPLIAQKLMDDFVRDPRPEHTKQLTPRQKEVLHLLAEGRTMKETAELLHLTPRTVAFHKYRIMEEFGLKSNSDLVRFAIREHVVSSS
ncbi:MAG TPA: response regulator transcription factor [Terriglobales bacterium]|jgi:DNA-binding NarL/FixJ family response regulator